MERRDSGDRVRTLASIGLTIFLFLGAFARASSHMGGAAAILANFVVLCLVWWASVLLHEVGHAVAARSAGLEPYCLTSGGGPTLLRRRIGGVAVDLRWLPGSGRMIFASPIQRHTRWRLLAAYVGGPAATIVLLCSGLVVPSALHEITANTSPWLSVQAALVLVNGTVLFTVVVPLPRGWDVSAPRNDVLQILLLPFLGDERLEALAIASKAAEFFKLSLLREHAAACDEARRILEEDPTNWVVRLGLADRLLFAGMHEEADTHYRVLVEGDVTTSKAISPVVRAIILNNCAWNLFMTGDDASIGRAAKLSADAIAVLPKHPSVLGTRGAILIEAGEWVEGEELVRRALRSHSDRIPKASNLACLAIAAARQKKRAEAEKLIERAREMDRECELVPRAERDLARLA